MLLRSVNFFHPADCKLYTRSISCIWACMVVTDGQKLCKRDIDKNICIHRVNGVKWNVFDRLGAEKRLKLYY
jgi:hypothetical protein